ncbi:MAG: YdeI/OmpD-associated family protein, partial [Bacteroidota bacterium]
IVRLTLDLFSLNADQLKDPRIKESVKAGKKFGYMAPSFRKEYAKWLNDAKTDVTRQTRAAQSIEWIAEGKDRFWQYKK